VSRHRDIWAVLGIARTSNVADIRGAYARQLRSFDVDADPQRFMTLRDARDAALRIARQQPALETDALSADQGETPTDDVPQDVEGADSLSFTPPPLPDAAQITAHLGEQPREGTISVTVPPPPEADYRCDAAPVAAPAGDGAATLPGPGGGAHLEPAILDGGNQRGTIAVAVPDVALAAQMDQHYDAVRRLLAPHYGAPDERYLGADEEVLLAGHLDALLADPRLEQIAFREQAGAWFAEMAANSVPRSDSIVERLVATFGWAAGRGRIDQPRDVARVLARRDSLVFFRLVQEKKHPLNAAWRELVKPASAGSRRSFGVNRGDVQRLLKVVRENFPDLESCFDWYRVSLWETPGRVGRGGGAWRPAYFGLILLLGVLRAAFSGSDHSPPVTVPTPMSSAAITAVMERQRKVNDPVSDIAMALRDATGGMLTNDDLRKDNPKLGAELMTAWREAHDRGDALTDFLARTRRDLIRRANVSLRHAPWQLAAESRQLELDQFEATRQQSPALCGALMDGGRMPPIVATRFADRENALIRHALLESDGAGGAAPAGGKFNVPGAVMKDAAARAALSHDDLVAALNRRSTPARTCDARIALLQAALALPPKDGLKLLREM